MSDPGIAPDTIPDAPAEQPDAPEADTAVTEPDGEQDFHALAEEVGGLLAQEGDTIPVPRRVAERWNGEAQKYRERFQPYEKAFARVHGDDQALYLDWLNMVTSGDPEAEAHAVEWMRQVLDSRSPSPTADDLTENQPEPKPEDGFDPYDPNAIDERIRKVAGGVTEERLRQIEEERRNQEALTAFHAKGRELGYDPSPDAQDDARVAWQQVLLRVKERYYGEPDALEKAHRDFETWRSNNAKDFWQKKSADASLPTAPQDGTAPSGRTEPKTLDDAAKAARARIDAELGG